MQLSVVIPTKNRLADLRHAVGSICTQECLPHELILVDQSDAPIPKETLDEFARALTSAVVLQYVYDPSITGLVHAKDVGMRRSTGEVVCFLEDDIVLESAYLREIAAGFLQRPDMLGCSGLVSNPPSTGSLYICLYELFHVGIFVDQRPRHYKAMARGAMQLTQSRAISGGLSAWRRSVFDLIPFDTKNGFHMLEDFDFSTRATLELGPHFYINPRARLAHNFAPAGRDALGKREQRKVTEYLVYFKKRRHLPFAVPATLWLLCGLVISAAATSARHGTVRPLLGTFRGISAGVGRRVQ
jgi:GT2 family glycosyltransferase